MAREKWPPPGDIVTNDEAKKLWRTVRDVLVARGDLSPDDTSVLEAIARYVRADFLAREAREARAGELTATGSMGQPVAHPLIAVERQAEAEAGKFARELLLTPNARKAAADRDDPSRVDGSKFDGRFG